MLEARPLSHHERMNLTRKAHSKRHTRKGSIWSSEKNHMELFLRFLSDAELRNHILSFHLGNSSLVKLAFGLPIFDAKRSTTHGGRLFSPEQVTSTGERLSGVVSDALPVVMGPSLCVIMDAYPAAAIHMLLIPKDPLLPSYSGLGVSAEPLIQLMANAASYLATTPRFAPVGAEDSQPIMGFHRKASDPLLHLHILRGVMRPGVTLDAFGPLGLISLEELLIDNSDP